MKYKAAGDSCVAHHIHQLPAPNVDMLTLP